MIFCSFDDILTSPKSSPKERTLTDEIVKPLSFGEGLG